MRIVNDLHSRVLTQQSASFLHEYTAHTFSTIHLWCRNKSLVHNVETYGTAGQATDDNKCVMGRMHVVCCVTKATDTYSEYLILVALLRQHWFREGPSISS